MGNELISLKGFDGVEFPHTIDGLPLKFCIVEASFLKEKIGKRLMHRRQLLRDEMMNSYPVLERYTKLNGGLWYSGFTYFSSGSRHYGSVDFSITMNAPSREQIELLNQNDIETVLERVEKGRRKSMHSMIQSSDVSGLQNLLFQEKVKRTELEKFLRGKERAWVGSFRGKFMELLFMNLLEKSVKELSGEGSDSIFVKHPFYSSGNGYGTEIDAVVSFYKPSQLKIVLDSLQQQYSGIHVWYNERIR